MVGVVVEDREVVGAVVEACRHGGASRRIPEAVAPRWLQRGASGGSIGRATVFAAVVIDCLRLSSGRLFSVVDLPAPRETIRAGLAVSSPSVSSCAVAGCACWRTRYPFVNRFEARLGSKPLVTMMATSAAEPVRIPARRRESSSRRFTLNRRPFGWPL